MQKLSGRRTMLRDGEESIQGGDSGKRARASKREHERAQ